YSLIANVVEEKCKGIDLAKEDKEFIAEFYKYGFVGIMLDWIGHGMKDDYKIIVEKLSTALHGNIGNSIHNFEQ
ncbi:MAG TPA: dihydroxyacetone kinase transcriptional activator DhaS, partial [Lachnospiraceae bacterium]|nr:dihydroxyacetone kinase transcriptional activator DhaS [Lachnospiraceae bacterium]